MPKLEDITLTRAQTEKLAYGIGKSIAEEIIDENPWSARAYGHDEIRREVRDKVTENLKELDQYGDEVPVGKLQEFLDQQVDEVNDTKVKENNLDPVAKRRITEKDLQKLGVDMNPLEVTVEEPEVAAERPEETPAKPEKKPTTPAADEEFGEVEEDTEEKKKPKKGGLEGFLEQIKEFIAPIMGIIAMISKMFGGGDKESELDATQLDMNNDGQLSPEDFDRDRDGVLTEKDSQEIDALVQDNPELAEEAEAAIANLDIEFDGEEIEDGKLVVASVGGGRSNDGDDTPERE